jgi:hypothetical protein
MPFTAAFDLSVSAPSEHASLRKTVQTLDAVDRSAEAALKTDLAAQEAAKKERGVIDELEDKLTASTALVAAAAGTPEQAKEMLNKARAKFMQAAADGADTQALEVMVQRLEHLAKVAEENLERNKRAHERPNEATTQSQTAAIPAIMAAAE